MLIDIINQMIKTPVDYFLMAILIIYLSGKLLDILYYIFRR
mgnify:FL=1